MKCKNTLKLFLVLFSIIITENCFAYYISIRLNFADSASLVYNKTTYPNFRHIWFFPPNETSDVIYCYNSNKQKRFKFYMKNNDSNNWEFKTYYGDPATDKNVLPIITSKDIKLYGPNPVIDLNVNDSGVVITDMDGNHFQLTSW